MTVITVDTEKCWLGWYPKDLPYAPAVFEVPPEIINPDFPGFFLLQRG